MIFPRYSILNAAPTNFKIINFESIKPNLEYPAPEDRYIMFDIGKGWLIINSFFFNKIHFKLSEYDFQSKIVDPVKDEIINNPDSISWYQHKSMIIFGLPIAFFLGLFLGLTTK